jgi:predicted restriction endonuclease
MPKCAIKGCNKYTRYINTKEIYCSMHRARIQRHGYPELKTDSHGLEKLPHHIVDNFIRKNCTKMIDKEILKALRKMGFKKATWWNVRYRRRRLGIKKYLSGEILKHRVWIRNQAIKKYGKSCELCGYKLTIDTHHIIPKKENGKHEVDNLIVLCPNCHALITREILVLKNRKSIPSVRKKLKNLLTLNHISDNNTSCI